MAKTLHHFIDGSAAEGKSGRFLDIYNPATGEATAKAPLANAAEVGHAIEVAKNAQVSWAQVPAVRRARVLFKFKGLVEAHLDELAHLITAEHGKTLEDARGSITRGLEVVEFACGIPHLLKGDFTENVGTNVDSFSLRQPLGVCAGVSPFNFPVMIPLWMFPLSIACGNAFVMKPSEKDPSPSLLLARLMQEAGLPDGVLNVVIGDKEAVDTLLTHPDVASVSFVGSTPVAAHIYATAAAHAKRVQALGGAKNHMVVMPDADLDQAVDSLIGAAYGSAGERCMAIAVAVAVEPVGDELIKRLKPRLETIRVGPGTHPDSDMGPLVTAEHLEKVKGYVDRGVAEGAKLVVDGRGLRLQGYEKGFFMGPCLFDHVKPGMTIYKDEIFGPVLCVARTKNYEEALSLVNEHPFGNGTAIFTREGDVARDFTARCKIGLVGINVPIPVPMAFHSFGGWKRSIFGDSNMHGPEGVRFFTRLKTVTSRWPSGIRKGAEFVIPTMR